MVVPYVLFTGNYGPNHPGASGNPLIACLDTTFGSFPPVRAHNIPNCRHVEASPRLRYRRISRIDSLCRQFWGRFGLLAILTRRRVLGGCDAYRLRIDNCRRLPGAFEEEAGSIRYWPARVAN